MNTYTLRIGLISGLYVVKTVHAYSTRQANRAITGWLNVHGYNAVSLAFETAV